ncbi:MAG: type II secretion system protein [Oscillospiraceae bacterium]|nr:type II secretion system protein [Oscillospiraceae bacterium]
MRRENNGGFTMIEVLVAIAILAGIVIPVCSSLLLSLRMNAKAEQVLQARLAVSSAVETLMAEGITGASTEYDVVDGSDRFPAVAVVTKLDAEAAYSVNGEEPTHYIVEVTDNDGLVAVTTAIRAADLAAEEEGAE